MSTEESSLPVTDAKAATAAKAAPLIPGQFARNASGLVRSASLWDAFGINATNGLFVLGIAWLLLYFPLYPGGNVLLAILIGTLLCLPITMTYLQLSIVYPRSGGDYVFNSRILHPAIGFAANFGLMMGQFFWIAFGGVYMVAYGITPALVTAGIQFHNQTMVDVGTWFQGQTQTFIVGTVMVALFGIFFVVGGNRAYFRFLKVAITLGGLALLVMVIYALVASRVSALANLNELFAGMGADSATSMVRGKIPAFSFHQTFLMIWWVSGYVMSAFYSAYLGGEVKEPGRNQILGGLSALVWLAGWTALVVVAMSHLLGAEFFVNLGKSFETSTFGPGLTPIYATLIAGAIGNGYVTIALMVCFTVLLVTVIGSNMLVSTRCMFAWGLDRIVPDWVSKVSSRSATPTSAVILVVIGSAVFGFLYSFGYVTALGSSWCFLIAYFIISISAMILPYRHTSVWESSPNANRLLGIPTITWWGALSFIGLAICSYVLLVDPTYGISPSANLAIFLAAPCFVIGALIYYFVARAVRSKEGINTDLNFSQIPPE
jgi:amino acid transporter